MAQESESEMGKLKNILKKNLRWVATGAVLALIMGGAFLGYRAYVQADAEFLFSISMQTDFSTVSKTDARAKIEPQLGTLPADFASRFNFEVFLEIIFAEFIVQLNQIVELFSIKLVILP